MINRSLGTVPELSAAGPSAGMAASSPDAGIYLVDKPAGPSSFRIVQQVRRALGVRKVGHAGTLDPFASGLLIVCAGRPATRMISRLMAGEKEYEAVLHLGTETDTLDPEGRVIAERPVPELSAGEIEACLAGFRGSQLQAPPAYSAVKHQGRPLYHYARRGISIAREPRPVMISKLEGRRIAGDRLAIKVSCSKGTYIRCLAADIGRSLGCGAHLGSLRRLRSGPFFVDNALPGSDLTDPEKAREVLLRHHLTVSGALYMIEMDGQEESDSVPALPERP